MSPVTVFVGSSNVAGYLPESDPDLSECWEDAKRSLIDRMRFVADSIEVGADDPYGETYAENLTAVAEDLTLSSGPEWSTYVDVGGEHGIPEWWGIEVQTMDRDDVETATGFPFGPDVETISMGDVVDELARRGIPAYVEQTGGGCATIYVGEPVAGRYAAVAGPGWFAGPGWTDGRGDPADFYVGPDDDGESTPITVTSTDPTVIADVIVGIVR